MLLTFKHLATVHLLLLYNLGLWYHHFSGIYLQCKAIYIAVVIPFLSYNSGLWYHYLGGIILLYAKHIATVQPNLF